MQKIGIFDGMYMLLLSVSVVRHTSLRANQELLAPEHDAVLAGSGVVRFFRISILAIACIDGVGLIH